MSQETQRADLTRKPVVYQIPGVDSVTIRRDIEYRTTDAGVLTMDIYYPPDLRSGERIPAVVLVFGFSDLGAEARLGCKLKEMESYISWGKLAAASGLVAIVTYNSDLVKCRRSRHLRKLQLPQAPSYRSSLMQHGLF